jgi:hypothetical protein
MPAISPYTTTRFAQRSHRITRGYAASSALRSWSKSHKIGRSSVPKISPPTTYAAPPTTSAISTASVVPTLPSRSKIRCSAKRTSR